MKLLAAVVMLAALVGCGGDNKDTRPGDADTVSTQPDTAVSPDTTQSGVP